MSDSQGIIYVAITNIFVKEAIISAKSVKKFLPNIKIVLFTDSSFSDHDIFDEVIKLEELHPKVHINKLICMMKSPFQETIFLDTDTFICGDISELFDLLNNFDIAMTHDRGYCDDFPENTGIPDAFREFNQGVIVYKNTEKLQSVLKKSLEWTDILFKQAGNYPHDQPPFRIALYLSDVRIATLTQEFNCRYHTFGHLNGEVKILHGRIPGQYNTEENLNIIAQKINKETIPRVFIGGKVFVFARKKFFKKDIYYPKKVATLFQPKILLFTKLYKRLFQNFEQQGIVGIYNLLIKYLKH
jgi:hypothetical protein